MEAHHYADIANPKIEGFREVALPQGLVASGFFSNAYLLDFDAAACQGIDRWHDDDRWQLVDFCRYVDDMRIVVRLGEQLQGANETEIAELVSAHLIRLLGTHAEGLILNPKKSSRCSGAGCGRRQHTCFRDHEAD
jgi:hypothetical protein